MSDHAVITGRDSSSANTRSSSILQPDFISSLYKQALSFHQQGRFEEAEPLYRQVLTVAPDHPGALHFLGMVRYARKDHSEAIRLVEKSLQLCDTKPVFFNNYGVVLKELKKYREAKEAFEKSLILDPNYPDALSNLGLVSILTNEPDHIAEHHLRSALRLQPDHRDALQHLIDLLLKHERYEETVPFVERQVACDPENSLLHHQLACLYGESGEIERAKHCFQKAASLGKLLGTRRRFRTLQHRFADDRPWGVTDLFLDQSGGDVVDHKRWFHSWWSNRL